MYNNRVPQRKLGTHQVHLASQSLKATNSQEVSEERMTKPTDIPDTMDNQLMRHRSSPVPKMGRPRIVSPRNPLRCITNTKRFRSQNFFTQQIHFSGLVL